MYCTQPLWFGMYRAPDDGMVRSTPISIEIGQRIAANRLRLTLSQKELGDLTETSASAVSRLERGDHEPTLASLIRLAGAMEIDLAVLTTGLDRETYLPNETFPPSVSEFLRQRGPERRRRRRH